MIHSDYVYSRGYRGKIKRVFLVFIFGFFCLSFFSVAKAGITENLEQRGVLVDCYDTTKMYEESIAKQPKFRGLALNEKAQCDITKNQIAEAKKNLTEAIDAYSQDAQSKFLLLQLEFEESLIPEKISVDSALVGEEVEKLEPKLNTRLFAQLVDRIKHNWPTEDFDSDPYYYIQEVGSALTPFTLALIYDYHLHMDRNDSNQIQTFTFMISAIQGKTGCLNILKNVYDNVEKYRIKNKSINSRAIKEKSYKAYKKQSDSIKTLVCEKIPKMKEDLGIK